MGEKFIGIMLIVTVALWTLGSALDCLIKNPNVGGVFLAIGIVSGGCLIVGSVMRDRM